MAYLGKSPSQGVRNRYYFTASGGETSISGALTGGTLTFTDGNYVDVNLNGVTLVAGTDYNTSTANTIAGLSALTASDVVEIVVYDVFSVFSGNVNSDFSVGGNLSVTGTTAFTGATTITGLTTTGDINFGDNDKAIFGASSDLQIYHDAGNSRIVDAGTGNLNLQADNNINILNNAGTEFKAQFITGGAVNLFHANVKKFETTATGITVDGTTDGSGVTAGLVSGQNVEVGLDRWTGSGSNFHQWQFYTDVSDLQIRNVYNNTKGTAFTPRVDFANNGDISFYADNGTTQGLFWDASTQRLGLGTTTPVQKLDVYGGNIAVSSADTYQTSVNIDNTDTGGRQFGLHSTGSNNTAGRFRIYDYDANAERMTITSGGKLCVGTTSAVSLAMLTLQPADTNRIINTRSFNTSSQYHHVFENNSGAFVGGIVVSTTSTAYQTSSDYRLKENVTADWDATTRLKQLNPVRFNFIADADTTVDGFLAHEVQSIVPEAITGTKDEVDEDGNPVMQGIDQSKLVPLLVKTIQELETRIAALET